MRRTALKLIPLALLIASCDHGAAQLPSTHRQPEQATSTTASQDTKSMNPDSAPNPLISGTGHDITPLTQGQKAPLIAKLTPAQIHVTQKAGTERPFCGTLLDNKRDGAYHCIVCDLPLFASMNKFDSGTGWPSFYQAFDPQHITRTADNSLGALRTEISCARCDAHLGHVFPDGPPPTGERHCLNSEALTFVDTDPSARATAYFAGGCFWGIEHYFQQGPGVIDAQSGYMNGSLDNPDYRAVCTGNTGHAEAVRVIYNPSIVSYERLLQAFFDMHDPTQINRQGPDRGTQYRSGIYTVTDEQTAAAKAFIATLNASDQLDRPIATEVKPAEKFYIAEDYHQDYIDKTGRVCHVADPWTDNK